MSNIRGLDFTTKIIVIILVFAISYIALYLALSQVLSDENYYYGSGMMGNMMHPTTDYTVAILLSITIALIAKPIAGIIQMANIIPIKEISG